jgi:hypothetical protein
MADLSRSKDSSVLGPSCIIDDTETDDLYRDFTEGLQKPINRALTFKQPALNGDIDR